MCQTLLFKKCYYWTFDLCVLWRVLFGQWHNWVWVLRTRTSTALVQHDFLTIDTLSATSHEEAASASLENVREDGHWTRTFDDSAQTDGICRGRPTEIGTTFVTFRRPRGGVTPRRFSRDCSGAVCEWVSVNNCCSAFMRTIHNVWMHPELWHSRISAIVIAIEWCWCSVFKMG